MLGSRARDHAVHPADAWTRVGRLLILVIFVNNHHRHWYQDVHKSGVINMIVPFR